MPLAFIIMKDKCLLWTLYKEIANMIITVLQAAKKLCCLLPEEKTFEAL
jgi:hypothetical protein